MKKLNNSLLYFIVTLSIVLLGACGESSSKPAEPSDAEVAATTIANYDEANGSVAPTVGDYQVAYGIVVDEEDLNVVNKLATLLTSTSKLEVSSLANAVKYIGFPLSMVLSVERSLDKDGFNKLTYHLDRDSDGRPDGKVYQTLNATNGVTKIQTDRQGRGVIDIAEKRTLNSTNGTIKSEVDYRNDGRPDLIEDFELDENNNVTKIITDSNADNTIDSITSLGLDEEGNVISVGYDLNADGSDDQYEYRTVDDNGVLVGLERDFTADGTIDEFWVDTSTVLMDGTTFRARSFDLNADNNFDKIETTISDDQGRIVRIELDLDGNNTTDRVTTRSYNLKDQVSSEKVDRDNDRAIDVVFTYEYDRWGNRIVTDTDADASGSSDRIQRETYDVFDRVKSREIDNNAIVPAESVTVYDRDSYGRIVREKFNLDASGRIDRIVHYERDAMGRTIKKLYDLDADNGVTADKIETFKLDKWGKVIEKSSYNNEASVATIDSQNQQPTVKEKYILNNKLLIGSITTENFASGTTSRVSQTRDNLDRVTVITTDSNNDGVLEKRESRQFDIYGNLTKSVSENITGVDSDGSLVVGSTSFIGRVFNQYGGAVIQGNDNDGDGSYEKLTVNQIDIPSSKIVAINTDNNYNKGTLPRAIGDVAPSTIDKIVRRVFDNYGRIATIRNDNNADGIFDNCEKREYDAYGNIVVLRKYSDDCKTLTSTRTRTYDKYGTALTDVTTKP